MASALVPARLPTLPMMAAKRTPSGVSSFHFFCRHLACQPTRSQINRYTASFLLVINEITRLTDKHFDGSTCKESAVLTDAQLQRLKLSDQPALAVWNRSFGDVVASLKLLLQLAEKI